MRGEGGGGRKEERRERLKGKEGGREGASDVPEVKGGRGVSSSSVAASSMEEEDLE